MSARSLPARAADPGDVRDQIRRLQHDGGTYRAIAAAAGLAPGTVHDLASGRRPPTPSTTRALSKVTSDRWRRQAADTYDQMAAQVIQEAEAPDRQQRAPGHLTADPEAGQ